MSNSLTKISLRTIKVERGDIPLTKKYFESGKWEVDIAGVRYPATVSLSPLYDPKNSKIKA